MHASSAVVRAALAALLVSAAGPLAAQAPATPPAPAPDDSLARAVVAVIESGNAAARGALIARALVPAARAADSASVDRLLATLHDKGAPFTLVSQSASGRHRLVKLRSARAGRTVVLDLATDRATRAGLGTLDVLEAHAAILDTLALPATRPASDAEAVALVRRHVRALAAAGAFSGTVYVAHRDATVMAEGFGLANREDSVANAPHTRFALASMGKMFTATAVLQLVEAHRLSLDDTLARVLPAYPNAERARRITIRQLLEHTAGLGDLWSTAKRPVAGLTGQLAEAGAVAWAPLLSEPGTRWSYSNEGYVVLAAVVEQVSGERFHDYLTRHVFAPAGMTETALRAGADDVIPHRSVGYRPPADDPLGTEPLRANWTFIGRDASGAGGGYSTVGDIARFGRALREGRLIGAALRDSMWTGRWDLPGYAGQRYGMATFVWPIGDRVAVGHGGGGTGSGIDNGFKQFTDGSWQVVALANMEPPAGGALADAIIRFLGAPVDRAVASSSRGGGGGGVTQAGDAHAAASAASAAPLAELTLIPQRTRWALEARVGGTPVRFALDIAGGLTLIADSVARRGGCTPWGRVTGFQMTGRRLDAARCDSVAVDLGPIAVTPPMSLVLPPSAVESRDTNLVGSLALDAFAGRALTLDLAGGRLIVESPASLAERVGGMREMPVRLVREVGGRSLAVVVGVPTAKGMVWMELDSGNGGTVLVSKPYAALVGLDSAAAGPQHADFELLPGVRVVTDRAFTPDMVIDGNLGMPFLRRWLITLDLAAGRGWIAPNPHPAAQAPEPALPPKK